MRHWILRTCVAAVMTAASLSFMGVGPAQAFDHDKDAQCRYYGYGQPDLFRNYYVPPACGGLGAQAYISPGPVPPLAGHTYITYQPLMPHEFMYHHHRTYHRSYDEGRGLTRTSAHWYSPPGKNAALHTYHVFRLPR